MSRSVAETVLTANDFGRAMIAPPGTRAELVKILRAAYAQALKDPELLAEAKKSNLDVDYTPGEQLQKLAREVMDQSARGGRESEKDSRRVTVRKRAIIKGST